MLTKKISSAEPVMPQTPLRNLFAYIRDLYNSAEPVYRFNEQSNIPAVKDVNYWELSKINDVHKLFLRKSAKLSQQESSETTSYVLRIRRANVPELLRPTILEEWLIITEHGEQTPTLAVKQKIERVNVPFDHSSQRVQAFNRYKKEVEKNNSAENIDVPDILNGWITVKQEEDKIQVIKNETGTEEELFEDNKERAAKYNKYEKYFADYFKDHWDNTRINKLYDALHQLHYELKGSDSKKLYLSFGLLAGKIGGVDYQNFLFHVPLTMNLKNQEIKIQYDTFANKIFCEQNFSELLDEHFKNESPYSIEEKRKEVLKNIDYFNSQPAEFYLDDAFIRSNYYDTALRITGVFSQVRKAFYIGDSLDYTFYSRIDQSQIMLSFSPVIQTRFVATQIAISKDASNIIQKINELEAKRQLQLIPDYFKKLFSITENPQPVQSPSFTNGFALKKTIVQEEAKPVAETSEKFLFPLPYNDEQLTIARRLITQDAVTVKGPPGTGKSHTIANLISHFVAEGKSILVISHNAKALTVLKDKLPKQIQDLAISLVNENKGNETLKASVNSIVSHLAQNYEEKEIKRLEEELAQLEQHSETVKENIYTAIQANTKTLKLQNPISHTDEENTACDWAKLFNGLGKPGIVTDKINYTVDTNNVASLVTSYIKTADGFTQKDFELANYNYHDDAAFISGAEFRKTEQHIQAVLQTVNMNEYAKVDYKVVDSELNASIESFLHQITALQELSIAPQISRHPNFNRALHARLLQENTDTRELVRRWNEKLLTYQLDTDSIKDIDPDILHKQIMELIGRFENNNTLSFLAKKMLSKEHKRFFECKINSITANELPHFKVLELYIHRNKKLKQLGITFSNYLNTFGINYLSEVQPILSELDFLNNFYDSLDRLNLLLETRKLSGLKYPAADFTARIDYLKKLNDYAAYKQLIEELQIRKKQILDQIKPHPLIHEMANAIDAVDRVKYEQLLEEYRQAKTKSITVTTANELFDQIFAVLPQTIRKIKADILEQKDVLHITTEDIENDLFYNKLESFLKHITQQTAGTETLFERLQTLKANIESKIAEVVAYKSWYHKTRLVDDKQKSALNAWLNDLINIGKGFGKNTARNIQSAIQNMQVAKGAVPIWIMQQESAITFFPDVSPAQFDLLIIDEASQCDISSLNLVFRCKKSIIVGDENQTSVSIDSLQFPIDKTNQVLDKYLISHPFKQQFNINNKNNSIYTLSGVIYPNIVVLREHFRCLPEIIGFSNSNIYNNDIVPLKTATHKIYGEPVEVHYVNDNIADEEKPLIAEKVITLIEEYITAYEQNHLPQLPTVGIITLDSSNIKHQNQLIRLIARSELIKQYEDKLALLLGTSREFQGDERDIMFLTITATHQQTEKGEMRPPRAVTGEEFMRIYNVAASRAKEKTVLLHSIHPDAIPLINPDCYRKKLLDYYNTMQIKPAATVRTLHDLIRKVDATSGSFEKEVCEMLYQNGLAEYIHPQYQIGHYKIDFGIISNHKKLALECDGVHYSAGVNKIKDDITRQLILERAGWRFFRIQSAEWFYNKEQMSKKIISWIEENMQEEHAYAG